MSRGMPTDQDIVYIDGPRHSSSTNAGRSSMFDAGVYGSERQRWQMACSTTTTTTAFYSVSRHRNLSGPCCTGNPRPSLDNRMLATPPPGVPASRSDRGEKENHPPHSQFHSKDNWRHHRKLDRSLSDSEDRINGNNGRGVNSSRYKTELCRPFEENGHCKYGDKCQFAHGQKELRNVTRHPKYKTELCRTYHSIGFCPYGPRCHFIHEDNLLHHQRKGYYRKPGPFILNPSAALSSSFSSSLSSNSSTSTLLAHRPCNLSGLNSLGSSFESVSSSSTPGNLSPSHVDDQFPPIGTFSPSEVSETLAAALCPGHQDSERSVFNFPASDAASSGSIMTPLNIQTQQMYNNMLDMAALARFNAVMNISQNNQHNNQSSANLNNMCKGKQDAHDVESWPLCGEKGMAVPPLSHSPVSLSDDSMGSNGSLEMTAPSSRNVDNAEHMINSPHDVSRSMRLPIFHMFSGDSES